MNLILCGPPFSGKSTVGKQLALKLNCTFIDTDDLIEQKTGMSKSDFYRQVGEQEYQRSEQEAIDSLSHHTSFVIALGGGITSSYCKSLGSIFYLRVPIEILWERLNRSGCKPAYLVSDDPFACFSKRISSRLVSYEQLAKHVISADRPVNEIVEQIRGLYGIK